MENKILIPIAVFCLSILIAQSFYVNPANAQLTFTVTPLDSYSGVINDQSACEYVSATEVWCSSTSGIKIINPTSRTITNTLYSGVSINDVDCTSSYCYSWHGGGSATANLTQWSIISKQEVNNRTFTMSGGGVLGRMVDALSLQGAENVLLPSSSTSCIGSGGTNLKGLCVFNSDPVAWNGSRFISSGDTGNAAAVFGIKFSDTTTPFSANVLILYQDGAGTRTLRIINLADSDSTFTNTQICTPTSATGFGATEWFDIFVYNDRFYMPFDNGSTGLYLYTPIDSTTCGTTTGFTTTWDIPTSLSTDGEFWYVSSYDGATSKSAVQVFNLTSTTSFATYNTTNTSGAGQQAWSGWYHSTEGELQILRGSNLVVFQVQEGTGSITDFCEQPENFYILSCVLERGDTTPLVGASETIGNSTNTIVCQLGLIACTNFVPNDPDTKTNGVGYLILFVGLGIMIGIFWVASRGDLGSIPTFLWFIATLSIVGVITAFDLIDATILIVAIIAIIALATAKVKGIFGSSGLFAGET